MRSLPSAEERAELLAGLRADPPRVAPRYFYDSAGSQLFDEITRTPEYYPTRTELWILRERGADIARHVPAGAVVVELGSGSGDKVIALFSHLKAPRAYRPIDISRHALEVTCTAVRAALPDLQILPYEGDFTDAAAYRGLPEGAPRLVYYSGSTIGNFEPGDAIRFVRALRSLLSPGDTLLLGADLEKDRAVLHDAYNDEQGVTASFNANMLRHLNARFGADFDPSQFQHRAVYNEKKRRIEMYLVATSPQMVKVGDATLSFHPSRPIHTESSYKYDFDDLRVLAEQSGFELGAIITDPRKWFAEAVFKVGR
jgi:dimethylhistidine N-methyltransferase